MTCFEYEEKINLLLDEELTEEEETKVKEHIEICASCKTYYNMLRTLHASFEEIGEEQAPEGFAESVMEQVRAAGKPKKPFSFRFPFTAAAAVIVIVLYAFNGHLFNQPKLADMTAKTKSSEESAADDSAQGGMKYYALSKDVTAAETPADTGSTSFGASIAAPDTANRGETQDAYTSNTAETANKAAVPKAVVPSSIAPESAQKSSVQEGSAQKTAGTGESAGGSAAAPSLATVQTTVLAVDTAPIKQLGSVCFAYSVVPKVGLKEALAAYTPIAENNGYTYYKMKPEEWSSIREKTESFSEVAGITIDSASEYGVIVVPKQ